jgi:hypothetical protein
MPDTTQRPVPLLGGISLDYVQHIEHSLEGSYLSTVIPGLEGQLQQRVARPSHRVIIRGILFGDGASDALSSLQEAAQNGEELTFSADITSALDIQQVVIDGIMPPRRSLLQQVILRDPAGETPRCLPGPAFRSSRLDDFRMGDLSSIRNHGRSD